MRADVKETTPPTAAKAPLVTALNQSEQVKQKVEECAADLSSINEVLKQEVTADLPLEQVQHALKQSEEVEVKVQECADDLSLVNRALAKEIRERKKLERKLDESTTSLAATMLELSETQGELSDTQIQEKQARHLALHDAVTGLPNRTFFNEQLRTALAQAKRHERTLAVMFMDVDKFKSINDSYGHSAGDKVLRIVSERLRAAVRDADTVARQSGDEFLCLMLEIKDEAALARAAAKIVESIAQPCEIGGLKLSVKLSIGITLYPQDGRTANVLLKNADTAMYKAKQGNMGYCFYSASGSG